MKPASPCNVRRATLLAIAAFLAGCQTPPAAPDPRQARLEALQKAGFVQSGNDWELSLGTKLLFDLDDDALSAEGRAALAAVANSLNKLGVERVRVEGHTDNSGAPRYNTVLSLRRAEAAAQELLRGGVADRAIERRGFGAERPVADNSTAEGRAQNRRVVITLVAD
jgi:outer membrane protein OmpA-like peptidoglycan-associated protein